MLKSLRLKNFTAFAEADLRFCGGLNVFIGENGMGKTHLLKLPYAVMAAVAGRDLPKGMKVTKSRLRRRLAEKLLNVLRPEQLGRLARRQPGRQRCEVAVAFGDVNDAVAFNFATPAKSEVVLERSPAAWRDEVPIFLPTRELLTIYPGFSALYDSHHLEFEETWRDTCQLLGAPTLRGPWQKEIKALLQPLEELMGGRLSLNRNGRFYFESREGSMEMPLVAEGVRKLAMLARLAATGALASPASLFWDEPETNLNPRLIKGVATAILELAARGVQVFVATHSLFLLREFVLLQARPDYQQASSRYFALAPPPKIRLSGTDTGVLVEQGDTVDDIEPLVSLDEELAQSDRYLELDAG